MADRRTFLKSLVGATAGLSLSTFSYGNEIKSDRLGEILPQRKLGRTNEYITMLGTGGYHVGYKAERDGQEVIEAALEGGVRFFDTAESYSKGISEERYGKFLTPKYRDLVFIMTKSTGRDAKTVQEHLEGSLRRMKTEQIDLFQVHSLKTPEDADERVKNGVLDYILKAQKEGKIKYLGFTGHQNPFALTRMLELTKESDIFDAVQMPVNILDQTYFSFAKNVIPKLQERNMGLLAMKSLAGGRFFAQKKKTGQTPDEPLIPNSLSIKEAMHFVWSLPVSVLISGNENATYMREKIALARSFSKLSETRKLELIDKVRDIALTGKVEYFKKKSI